ncbi:hypothetical protein Fcan01_13904 [Folsomia candida]|uniref:Uncharacterized protein n=1 Tax=Folsomia candida TaxID=158441 RepID=A0A226E1L8_FOLCA|nr:hypothetical protein Fcan01_13904 [Folsomia candida]
MRDSSNNQIAKVSKYPVNRSVYKETDQFERVKFEVNCFSRVRVLTSGSGPASDSKFQNPKLSGSGSGPKNLIPKFRVRVGFGFRLTTRNPNQQEFFATTNAKKLKKKIKVLTTLAKTFGFGFGSLQTGFGFFGFGLPSGFGSVVSGSGSGFGFDLLVRVRVRVLANGFRVLRVRVALGFRISGIGFGFGFRICKNPTREKHYFLLSPQTCFTVKHSPSATGALSTSKSSTFPPPSWTGLNASSVKLSLSKNSIEPTDSSSSIPSRTEAHSTQRCRLLCST